MKTTRVAAAIERVRTALTRRPHAGLHDDAPATARWKRDAVVECSHANGTRVLTDMPQELGGSGQQVTPGWLFRAGMASCAATSIAMKAAACNIDLTDLEVQVFSRSDTRGLLGMTEVSGAPVSAAPTEIHMTVRIAASDVPEAILRKLAQDGVGCAPVSNALQCQVPFDLHINTNAAG